MSVTTYSKDYEAEAWKAFESSGEINWKSFYAGWKAGTKPMTNAMLEGIEWIVFDGSPEHGQSLPYERREVLVQIAGDDELGMPPSVAVGYLRFASDSVSPYFVVPGFGRRFTVTHWNDCLGDHFKAPLWDCKQTIPK